MFLQCFASLSKWGQLKSYFRQVKSSQNTSSTPLSLSLEHTHTHTHTHSFFLSLSCPTKKCDYETNTICNNGLEYKEVQLDNIFIHKVRLWHVFLYCLVRKFCFTVLTQKNLNNDPNKRGRRRRGIKFKLKKI